MSRISVINYRSSDEMSRDWVYHSPFYVLYNNGSNEGPLCWGPWGCRKDLGIGWIE